MDDVPMLAQMTAARVPMRRLTSSPNSRRTRIDCVSIVGVDINTVGTYHGSRELECRAACNAVLRGSGEILRAHTLLSPLLTAWRLPSPILLLARKATCRAHPSSTSTRFFVMVGGALWKCS